MRRILRIWPAYYLLVFIMLVVYRQPFFEIPYLTDAYLKGDFSKSNTLYLLLLPHLAPFVNSTSPYVHPTYTIGIEEQFYLIWGLLFYFFPKHAKRIIVFMAVAGPIFNVLHSFLHEYTSSKPNTPFVLVAFKKTLFYYSYSKLSIFAIGSLLGYAFFNRATWVEWLGKKRVQYLLYLLLFGSFFFVVETPFIQNEYMAATTGLLMLMATFREKSIFNYSHPLLERLGKVSYGIYLFHIFAIVFAIKFAEHILGLHLNTPAEVLFLSSLTVALSILFGYISYEFYELKFLKLKNRFRRV